MVIMYADKITDSMQKTIDETNRRRAKQIAYNEEHNVTPQPIVKARNLAVFSPYQENMEKAYMEPTDLNIAADPVVNYMSKSELEKSIEHTRKLMKRAAKDLDFIQAAQYRDEMIKLEELLNNRN